MDRGYVLVDEYMQTNVPTISAVGDLVPTLQLAHVGFPRNDVEQMLHAQRTQVRRGGQLGYVPVVELRIVVDVVREPAAVEDEGQVSR